ncbi:MAG: DNA methyltransferase, partial [Candidatus Saccharimonadales bacterium]
MTRLRSFRPVTARSHTPPYKIHRYFARRPWNLFDELIQHYAAPGDIILDPFCGGGVTPYEAIKNKVQIVACDVNPLATFVVSNMFHRGDMQSLEVAFKELLTYARSITKESFTATCPSCESNDQARWYELAHTVVCDACDSPITLVDEHKIRNGVYRCPNSQCWNAKKGVTVARVKRSEPVYLSLRGTCGTCKQPYTIAVDQKLLDRNKRHLARLRKLVKTTGAALPDELIPLEWDRQREDLLHEKGFDHFQDLFTEKNLLVNYLVLAKIKEYEADTDMYALLRFVFSDSLRDTNIMTFTSASWQGGAPSSWAKHAYWLPPQFCEVNVARALERSFASIKKSITYNNDTGVQVDFATDYKELQNGKNLLLKTGTLADLRLPDRSIDVIITDPPYGSNVQYLELSHFWHMWNRDMYDQAKLSYPREAVVTRKQNFRGAKSYQIYEDNLYAVFAECTRVLKPGGAIVMTFNNKDIKAWLALLISVFRAGFHFEPGGITFQDGVANYKHTAHTRAARSPYGDFIYEFIKDTGRLYPDARHIDRQQLAEHILSRIQAAVSKYQDGANRSEILIELFNDIVPEIEQFVRCFADDRQATAHDLYA